MKKNDNKGIMFFVAIISLLVIATVAFLVGYYFGVQSKECQIINAKFGDIETNVKRTSLSEIYQRVGFVTQKNTDSLVINSQSNYYGFDGGGKAEYKDFKVIVNPQTEIVKTVVLKNGDEKQESATFDDVVINKTIKVVSSDNVKDKNEITATKIYLITDEK